MNGKNFDYTDPAPTEETATYYVGLQKYLNPPGECVWSIIHTSDCEAEMLHCDTGIHVSLTFTHVAEGEVPHMLHLVQAHGAEICLIKTVRDDSALRDDERVYHVRPKSVTVREEPSARGVILRVTCDGFIHVAPPRVGLLT